MQIKKLDDLNQEELSLRMHALDTMPFEDFIKDVSGRKARFVQRRWIGLSVRLRLLVSCEGPSLSPF